MATISHIAVICPSCEHANAFLVEKTKAGFAPPVPEADAEIACASCGANLGSFEDLAPTAEELGVLREVRESQWGGAPVEHSEAAQRNLDKGWLALSPEPGSTYALTSTGGEVLDAMEDDET